MAFRSRHTVGGLALFALGAAAAGAQYKTPVGSGVAKPKTLRATAVLEWTGSLEKPNASRLMPIAVWDGEHYQPAGLYLARPDPLALATGTQYELERSGEPAGLFNVRGAAQLHGDWVGMGKFQPEAAPPPPPKLKTSKQLPVHSNGKADDAEDGRPTLHRKAADGTDSPNSGSTDSGAKGTGTGASAGAKPGAPAPTSPQEGKPADPPPTGPSAGADQPTLHKRTARTDEGANPGSSTASADKQGGSSTSDQDRPTLHKRGDSPDAAGGGKSGDASAKVPEADPDRPTLHRQDKTDPPAKAPGADPDPDRPTLHRARSGDGVAAASIDPDRPHLRYGKADDAGGAVVPVRLEGAPPAMQQIVAISDVASGESRPYQYHWAAPEEATKMQAALAALAAQAVARPNPQAAKPSARFGPASKAPAASKASTRKTASAQNAPVSPVLVEERFTAYELSFSGGATLVYSAHTADEGPQRVYVTLIAQPDFAGKPQVLLQQVARGDRLDETPAMQLVDAADTDDDQRAELIFQLTGAATSSPVEATPGADADSASAGTATLAPVAAPARAEREFAIYRVANGKAFQVFNTGPLP